MMPLASAALKSGDMLSTGEKLRSLSQLAAIVKAIAPAKMGKCLVKGTCRCKQREVNDEAATKFTISISLLFQGA
jgi:hypothetical protein